MPDKTLVVDLNFTVPEPVEVMVRGLVRTAYKIAQEEARAANYRPAIGPEAVLGVLLHFAPSYAEAFEAFEATPKPPEEEPPKDEEPPKGKKGKKPEADA